MTLLVLGIFGGFLSFSLSAENQVAGQRPPQQGYQGGARPAQPNYQQRNQNTQNRYGAQNPTQAPRQNQAPARTYPQNSQAYPQAQQQAPSTQPTPQTPGYAAQPAPVQQQQQQIAPPVQQSYGGFRAISILPSTDTSGMGLGVPLQKALGQLLYQTGLFQVKYAQHKIKDFSEEAISGAFQNVATQLIAFSYLENEKVSLFLLDSDNPSEYLVSSQPLTDPTGGNALVHQIIEYNFKVAFNNLLMLYSQSKFKPLPGKDKEELSETEKLELAEKRKENLEESKRFYTLMKEMEEDRSAYIGGSVGMTQFSAVDNSASVVNFGITGGYPIGENSALELGLDVFSYALLHSEYRYRLPILPEKFVSLSLATGPAMIVGSVTDNIGFQSIHFESGTFALGAGVGVDIPLLGIVFRGDIRFYYALNGATLFFGTYGVMFDV